MIPLTLVTGFLGSGKTTLLRRLASADEGHQTVFVVNEFAQVDVDAALLEDVVDGNLVAIPGGSIFCTCLTATFCEHLEALARRHRDERYRGIVVEASGMADPRVLRRMLADTKLERRFTISRVIAVAEPVSLPKLLQTLPNVRHQIEAADVILLNRRLGALADLLRVGRRCRDVQLQNLGWALAYNLCAIPAAATGLVPPWLAALGMASSSVLVMLNAGRLLRVPTAAERS